MRIPLTIKTTYLPSWGGYEGVRECLQNGVDAQTEFDAPLTVRHRKETDTIVIENEGCTLPYEALLLGHTTKVGRADLRGQFGEGLKVGCLALVRAGHSVKIRSGGEVWVPSIQRSEQFQADVLVFDIEKGRKEQSRVAIEIGGITAADWAVMKECFLFLNPVKDADIVRVPGGALLLNPCHKGKIFVKGIFVSNDPKLAYGYDLADAQIDRDRKIIAQYDLQSRTQGIWREALGRRPELCDIFGQLLVREASDLAGVDDWNATLLPAEAKKAVSDAFVKAHGSEAIPVGTLGDSQDVEHLGKKGVVVPRGLRHVLEQTLGSVNTNKAKLREEVVARYGWHDLSEAERVSLVRAIEIVHPLEPVSINDIDVVDFRDVKIQGMFKDGRFLLAKKNLADRNLTLEVLVHEVAHRVGGDGEKSHVANIERIWSGIVARLTTQS